MNTATLPEGMKIFGESAPAPEPAVPGVGHIMKHRVPASAIARYDMFRAAAAEAEALMNVHRQRLEEARRLGHSAEGIMAQGAARMARAGAARSIVNSIGEWLASDRHLATYVPAAVPKVKFSRAALDSVAAEVSRLRDELSRISVAPLSAAERKAALKAQIAQYRAIGRPNVSPEGNQLQPVHPDGILQFMAWVVPEDVWDARIDELVGPDRDGAMSSADKTERLSALRKQLAAAELKEVTLVDVSDGDAHYRPSTSIPALLHLVAG